MKLNSKLNDANKVSTNFCLCQGRCTGCLNSCLGTNVGQVG